MKLQIKKKWLQYLLKKKENRNRLKLLLLVMIFLGGILFTNFFLTVIQSAVSQSVTFPTNPTGEFTAQAQESGVNNKLTNPGR